ncbi:replicative DNA helicase [Tritonibacter multivorans]|uniref:Replicative DNA helicase n=1 Tax=Tritonibacter multivorans TaxID=928856 RepID=A0A0P1G9U6_9RHOB|nr:DNA helicase [Tritonibacter multivorans]MDA7421276.1 DNA helicase [Tritonibacter multivorans]CUH78306.1 replicative DNA helicase [Tritonibacter multivorans]SFD70784.1 DnaB-like helicase C terminal domain-containing protein [Tritonibacter multivorans]
MQLSAPIHRLKHNAKRMARQKPIALHEALDHIAVEEGFQSWSHLAAASAGETPATAMMSNLKPGDLVLLGARPGQGKTRVGLELACMAAILGRQGYFFTLDYHERDIADLLASLNVDRAAGQFPITVDTSDDVSADYVISRLQDTTSPALIVVDYLQLLDQKRVNSSLPEQIAALRKFVKTSAAICVVISQIDRMFDLSGKDLPDVSDVRLPNPLDLSVFDKTCFLHNGAISINTP